MSRQQLTEQRRMRADAGEVVRVGRGVARVEAVAGVVERVFHEHAERQGALDVSLQPQSIGERVAGRHWRRLARGAWRRGQP